MSSPINSAGGSLEIDSLSGPLKVELVPSTSWGANLRKALPKSAWDKLRKITYRLADYRCEICGGVGTKHPVECHEVWEYEDIDPLNLREGPYTQKLVRLIALCPSCHEVKHFGLASVRGHDRRAFHHLIQVNGWGPEQAHQHLADSQQMWHLRSSVRWKLDLSWLADQGVAIPGEPWDDIHLTGSGGD